MRVGNRILNLIVLLAMLMAAAPVSSAKAAPSAAPAMATSSVVNNSGDLPDSDLTDGVCLTVNNNCTLRAAIMEANVSTTGSMITFSGSFTITPDTALPPITADNVIISGLGHTVVLDGTDAAYSGKALVFQGASNGRISRLTIVDWGLGAITIDGTGGLAQGNVIGTDGDGNNDADERLRIYNNGGYAVEIKGAFAIGNIVAGNEIGRPGDPNQSAVGIWINANHNIIGTNGDGVSDSLERNLIRGNDGGIGISNASNNVIAGNYIGVESNGSTPAENGTGIVLTAGANGNRIGTDGDGVGDMAERNVISKAYNSAGVHIQASHSNVVAGNLIGVNLNGTSERANAYGGVVLVSGSTNNIIGTNGDGIGDDHEGNVISGNGVSTVLEGIMLNGAIGTVIAGNYIGTNAAGTAAIPNAGNGIGVYGGQYNRIGTDGDGTSDALEGNVISGNDGHGIFLRSGSNAISGNKIGTDASGANDIGNDYDGIQIFSASTNASENLIGGLTPVMSNTIAYNNLAGVRVAIGGNGPADNNAILRNSIFSNGELGIDLATSTVNPEGVTPNDHQDFDGGPNHRVNFPELQSASASANHTYIDASIVDGLANTQFRLQFFEVSGCDASGHGEGRIYIGETVVNTDLNGNATSGPVSFSGGATVGNFVTATATRQSLTKETSEFSECLEIETAPQVQWEGSMLHWILIYTRPLNLQPGVIIGSVFAIFLLFGLLGGMMIRSRQVEPAGCGTLVIGGGASVAVFVLLLGGAALIPRFRPPAEIPPEPFALPTVLAPTAAPTMPLPTAAPTDVPTEVVEELQFIETNYSTDAIYYESEACGPKEVDIAAMANDPEVYSLVLFYRVADQEGDGATEWTAEAMNPLGNGMFGYSLHSENDVPGFSTYLMSYLQMQFVATDVNGDEVGRTDVLSDVELNACLG